MRGLRCRWAGVSLCCLVLAVLPVPVLAADCVVLLHGLGRTAGSMAKMAKRLTEAGYRVVNDGYPSRSDTIENLAAPALESGVAGCRAQQADRIDLVSHSMGGMLIRYYLSQHALPGLHRIVMLAPPNQGSKVVNTMRHVPGFRLIMGPGALEMGTGEDSLPLEMGPLHADLGIIAGNRTINPAFSLLLDNPDDGAVSVASARLEGMCAFVVMPATHAFITRNDAVIGQVIHYLESGEFSVETAENGLCDP